MGALITVLAWESGAREEKQSTKEEAFDKAGVRMMYTIGYNQDSERRTVPGSHWNHWGPTASSSELEGMMLSSRSVLSLSPFPPSQSGPGSISSHGYLSPPLLLVWPPVFRSLIFLVCTSSLEDHMHTRVASTEHKKPRTAVPALPLHWAPRWHLWSSRRLFFVEFHCISSLKGGNSTSEFTKPPAKPLPVL